MYIYMYIYIYIYMYIYVYIIIANTLVYSTFDNSYSREKL